MSNTFKFILLAGLLTLSAAPGFSMPPEEASAPPLASPSQAPSSDEKAGAASAGALACASPTSSSLTDLPVEVLENIFGHLNRDDLSRLGASCVGLNKAVKALANYGCEECSLDDLRAFSSVTRTSRTTQLRVNAPASVPSFSPLKNFSCLESLELNNVAFGPGLMRSFAEHLPSCGSLRALLLNEINFSFIDRDIGTLAGALPRCRLSTLRIYSTTFGTRGLQAFARALSQCPTLRDLSLENCCLRDVAEDVPNNCLSDPSAMVRLVEGLPPQLTHLNLNRAFQDPRELPALIRALVRFPGLIKLDLSLITLGDEAARELSTVLPRLPNLETLVLVGNRSGGGTGIQEEGFQALAGALLECLNLRSLDVANNRGANTKGFMEALPRYRNLQTLNLSGNPIREVEELVKILPNCNSLVDLNLADCRLGDFNFRLILPSLSHIRLLTTLNLSENGIQTVGARELARVLDKFPRLEVLDLSDNTLEDRGASDLAAVLPTLPSLRSLNLDTTGIGDLGMQAIAGVLPHCSLETLRVLYNGMTGEGVEAIARALPHCLLKSLFMDIGYPDTRGEATLIQELPNYRNLRTLSLRRTERTSERADLKASIAQHKPRSLKVEVY